MRARLRHAATVAVSALVLACDRPPSAEGLPEWTPNDHVSKDDRTRMMQGQVPAASKDAAAASAAQTILDVTWRNQCALCHGMVGRGDGPQGPMFRATDLTSAEWQSRVTDDDIRNAIKNGKGKMPKFDLPDDVLSAMVVRVRSLKGR
jgi:cytochrome c oxidase cbb3-type subunit 3